MFIFGKTCFLVTCILAFSFALLPTSFKKKIQISFTKASWHSWARFPTNSIFLKNFWCTRFPYLWNKSQKSDKLKSNTRQNLGHFFASFYLILWTKYLDKKQQQMEQEKSTKKTTTKRILSTRFWQGKIYSASFDKMEKASFLCPVWPIWL